MTKTLHLDPSVVETITQHALDEAPLECCGILTGPHAGKAAHAHPVKNVHENPRTEYEIDPHALHQAVTDTQDDAHEIVAFYHSHPQGPARFSTTDHARASWPDTAYIILSLDPLTFHAGRWDGQRFQPITLHARHDA